MKLRQEFEELFDEIAAVTLEASVLELLRDEHVGWGDKINHPYFDDFFHIDSLDNLYGQFLQVFGERRSEDSVPPDVAEAVLTALKPKVDALRREIEFKKAEQREPYRLPYVIGKSQEFLNELSDEDLQLLQSLGQIQSSLDLIGNGMIRKRR